MKTIALADDIVESLALVPGKDVEEKISRLLENTFVLNLRECEDYLFKFESKYRHGLQELRRALGTRRYPGKALP